jgi:hypothetical protein
MHEIQILNRCTFIAMSTSRSNQTIMVVLLVFATNNQQLVTSNKGREER